MAIDVETVLRQESAGLPRYTSYPPANHFIAGMGPQLLASMASAVRKAETISAYLHIPFCDRMCWFCGCHTKQTLRYEPIGEYIEGLIAEIGLWNEMLGMRPALSALHLGGGSPSLLRQGEWKKLGKALRDAFQFTSAAEIAVELDPSDNTPGLIENLKSLGLTRASIGVQDFDPVVQAAINRPQSFDETRKLVDDLRGAGVVSINIDALYGLPLQTEARLRKTLEQVISLTPDRVALFGYAHVPWLKAHQRLIKDADLPGGRARYDQAGMAREILVAAGYQAIGIDHFALPGDALAQASNRGQLVRNFQGYTTDAAKVRLGFGPSAIGCFPGGFVQNEVAIGRYASLVAAREFPLARGLAVSLDDQIHGYIIERLMCDLSFSFGTLTGKFGAHAEPAIQLARRVAASDRHGLCAVDEEKFYIKPDAIPFVRLVASNFDQWLTRGEKKYSKVV